MEKLVVIFVNVTNVLVAVGAQPFEGRNAPPHREVLVKSLLAPIISLPGGDNGLETATLITLRHWGTSPVKKGGGKIEVEGRIVDHLPTSGLGRTGIPYNHGNAQGFLVMGPLPREPTITHVVAVVGGIDDDGVIGQTLRLKGLNEAPDGVVDSTHHP